MSHSPVVCRTLDLQNFLSSSKDEKFRIIHENVFLFLSIKARISPSEACLSLSFMQLRGRRWVTDSCQKHSWRSAPPAAAGPMGPSSTKPRTQLSRATQPSLPQCPTSARTNPLFRSVWTCGVPSMSSRRWPVSSLTGLDYSWTTWTASDKLQNWPSPVRWIHLTWTLKTWRCSEHLSFNPRCKFNTIFMIYMNITNISQHFSWLHTKFCPFQPVTKSLLFFRNSIETKREHLCLLQTCYIKTNPPRLVWFSV